MPRPTKTTLESFQHAFDGIGHVIRTQRRMQVHLVLAAGVLAAGVWVRLSREQWFVVFIAMALVFITDMMDTAISACVDLFAEKYRSASDRACRIAAGASMMADLMAAAMIAVIFLNSPL